MKIKSFTNSVFSSKSYVLYDEQVGRAWLVDMGDVEPVVEFLRGAGLSLAGVLITHCHFDHIYGLNGVCGEFAGCRVVTNEKGLEGLLSAKLNMSRYHEKPFVFEFGERVDLVADGDVVSLFDGVGALVVHMPGHNDSCLCFVVDCEGGGFVFTGDAFIPGVKVVTNLPGGDRAEAERSVEMILELAREREVMAGHEVGR